MKQPPRTADMVNEVVIPLDRIIADPQYQPRLGGIVDSQVSLLMESDPETWPPLVVAPHGDSMFVVIDGFHRIEAATRLKVTALPCIVQPSAGYPEAVIANVRHGLPLSRSDRKDAARWWAATEPNISYREIGRRTGLSDKTVKAALTEGDRPERSRQAPDPVARFVTHVLNADNDAAISAKKIRREIEAYEVDDQHAIAESLENVGRELLEAVSPFMKGGSRA